MHGVGDECVPDTLPARVGVHRDPLEVTLIAGAAGDRVTGEQRLRVGTGGAELAYGCGVERVAESERAESPERR